MPVKELSEGLRVLGEGGGDRRGGGGRPDSPYALEKPLPASPGPRFSDSPASQL